MLKLRQIPPMNQWMILRIAILSGGLAVTNAAAAYLPVCGPVPLRFARAPADPVSLPPLPVEEPPPAVPLPAPVESRDTVTRAASATAEPLLTPAMIGELLRSHRPAPTDSEKARTDVVVPFGFFPPLPGPRVGSSALYEVR
jgi:hypothetical protein